MLRKLKRFFGGRLFPCALLALLVLAGACAAAITLPRLLAPLAVAERLFSLAVALFLVNGEKPAQNKISELTLLLFLPVLGGILCLLLRRKHAPCDLPQPTEGALIDRIAAIGVRCSGVLYASDATYYPTGADMKGQFLRDLANAKKSIWLEYYIVEQGKFFGEVLAICREKAAAGVDVRLVYDSFGCALTLPKKFPNEMKRAGIRVKAARPVRFSFDNLNRRNHRKIAVVDGEIAYVGGINLADEYTGEKIRFGHWKDTALRVCGQPALRLAKLFASDANVPQPKGEPSKGSIPCAVIADDAFGGGPRAGLAAIGLLISNAKRFVYCCTPYLTPDELLLADLKRAAATGADVRVLIPHIPDKKLTFLMTRHSARALMRAGVQVREYTAGFLHAKSVVADDYAFVSSYNLDARSLYLQAECGVLAQDEALAEGLKTDFCACWEEGTPVRSATRFERALLLLLRPFAPLL